MTKPLSTWRRTKLAFTLKRAFNGAPVSLWLALRLISLVTASLAILYESSKRSTSSFGDILFSPWYSYDTLYYIRIVQVGYKATEITSGFHPLYPWTATLINLLVHSPILSLMIVSSVCGVLLTIAYYRLALVDHATETASTATKLFLFWPITIAIFAPYTEALFLLLVVCSLFGAVNGRYWLAGIAGGLASLTRQSGIFLCLPLAWEIWEGSGKTLKGLVQDWRRWIAIALIPFGYAIWILYRAFAISDVKPNFSSLQAFIYSVMISPTHYKVFADQQFLPPWTALWRAVKAYIHGGLHWSAYGDALLGFVFIAMFILSWRHLRTSYRIYSLAIVLIALSLHTGVSLNPYTALPRHLLPALPVFMGVAESYKFRSLPFVLFVLCTCQVLVLCCFVWQTWVL
jgi:hypothetical protein